MEKKITTKTKYMQIRLFLLSGSLLSLAKKFLPSFPNNKVLTIDIIFKVMIAFSDLKLPVLLLFTQTFLKKDFLSLKMPQASQFPTQMQNSEQLAINFLHMDFLPELPCIQFQKIDYPISWSRLKKEEKLYQLRIPIKSL